jgi:hypothetical protein
MRKFWFLLSISLTFGLAILFGYSVAAKSNAGSQNLPDSSPNSNSSEASQQNLLIIQIDQIDTPQPNLQSVWLAAYFQSEHQTVLTFTQLYPSQQNKRLSALDKTFPIDQNGALSRQFLRSISAGNIQWNGYLIIDRTGAHQIEQWLVDQGVPIFDQDTSSPREILETACGYLRSGSAYSEITGSTIDWNHFNPHFQTDMEPSSLMSLWNGLFDTTHPTRCEVIFE